MGMAVSDARISQIEREMADAERELRRVKAAMNAARDEVAEQNRRQLAALTAQTEERLRQRDQHVQKQYEAMLEKSVSAREKLLEQEFRSYQAKYEDLAGQMRAALAEEQRKTEEALLVQKKFEQAYFARRELAQKRAEEVCAAAFSQVREILRTVPLEWFTAGCTERYRTALQNMEQWMKEGFFESVIAIGENLRLSIQLDELQAEERCRKWFHYYQTLYGALDAEHRLLFETAVRVPEELGTFRSVEHIVDSTMQSEQLAFWSDGSYQKLLEEYSTNRAEMERFQVDGAPLANVQAARQFMIAHPELSASYSEMQLYGSAMKTAQRMERTEQQIRLMHSRMRCYDERRRLAKELTGALLTGGYSAAWKRLFNDKASTLGICFRDSMNVLGMEIYFIPVLRRADNSWVNTVSCALPRDAAAHTLDEIRHILAEVLVTQGIGIDYGELNSEQEAAERVRILTTDSRLRINGRLN